VDSQSLPIWAETLRAIIEVAYNFNPPSLASINPQTVEHLPCANQAAQRFYQRAGMLLCLLHILRVTDCHHQNLVANGEHFVLVDMETLMQPETKLMADFPQGTEVEKIVGKQFWDSVVRTGLLLLD
jgi:lantibiotic modifying enzyme